MRPILSSAFPQDASRIHSRRTSLPLSFASVISYLRNPSCNRLWWESGVDLWNQTSARHVQTVSPMLSPVSVPGFIGYMGRSTAPAERVVPMLGLHYLPWPRQQASFLSAIQLQKESNPALLHRFLFPRRISRSLSWDIRGFNPQLLCRDSDFIFLGDSTAFAVDFFSRSIDVS